MRELDHLRRTGRTTRMLVDAIRAAIAGRDVVVLCAHHESQRHLFSETLRMCGPEATASSTHNYRCDMGGAGRISFRLVGSDFADMCNGTVRGSDATLFADHHAIEAHMGWAPQQWLKYSNPFVPEK